MTAFEIGDTVRIPNYLNRDIEFVGGETVCFPASHEFAIVDKFDHDAPGIDNILLATGDRTFNITTDAIELVR